MKLLASDASIFCHPHLYQSAQEDWQRILGTTAEWLFMAGGRRMLTVKGLMGGERALPSSFAMSAAAFGRTPEVRFLSKSSEAPALAPKKALTCSWSTLAHFS